MPLPWLFIFLLVFFSFFSIKLFLNFFFFPSSNFVGLSKVSFLKMNW